MLITSLLILPAVLLCVFAAVTDIKRLEIDNWIPVSLMLLFALYAALMPVAIPAHVATMLVVLLLGLFVHKSGIMGGGDIKLLVALSLWAGVQHLPLLLLVTSLSGALVALLTLVLQKPGMVPLKLVPAHTGLAWIDTARAGQSSVAYGIAIAIGAVAMFSQIGGL